MDDVTGSVPSEMGDNYKIVISPGLTKYYVPICEPTLIPFIDQQFANLELALEFYQIYAAHCGFDIRLGTTKRSPDGSIMWKYVLCNREGEKKPNVSNKHNNVPSGKLSKWKVSMRFGCKAYIAFRICAGGAYVVKHFEEQHSHPLCSQSYRQFMKLNRNLNPGHQKFVLNCARVNIGATKSYRLYKEAVGGYANIGCTIVEFKNFSHDLRAYASGVDAQMLLDNLFKKREISPAFYYEFDVDEKDQLSRLFWSDPIWRRNYAAFGDVVSLDATYSMNRYNLIFTPFTGIDNHRRIVTFGAGLLSGEDIDSYSWLLEKFEDCMGSCPRMIVTDQDPALRTALERVLKTTRHRLCMWHIMKNIPDKLPPLMKSDKIFRQKFDNIVWDEFMEPAEFDNCWEKIMDEFHLVNDSWFISMFHARSSWIPAYFRDFPLSGLLKTTSVSESVNSYFSRFLKKSSNLIEFFMQYDSALDSQRHAQDLLNAENASSSPDLKTPLVIEKHALNIYTNRIFLETQSEIVDACFKCRVLSIKNEGNCCAYKVHDGTSGVFDVVYNGTDSSYVCSCKKFIRVGVLCCHIFVLFKDLNVDVIPNKYIHCRWTKLATLKASIDIGLDVNRNNIVLEGTKLLLSQLYSVFYSCIGLVDGNVDRMNSLLGSLHDYRDSISSIDSSSTAISTNRRLFSNYYGSDIPDVVSVFPPVAVKTKGSGRRIKSSKELAIESSKKPLRLCRRCNKKMNHDSRNCDKLSKVVE